MDTSTDINDVNAVLRRIQDNPFDTPIERLRKELEYIKTVKRITDGLFEIESPLNIL